MSIKRPDLYEHQNPDLAIVDSDNVRGGRRQVANRATLYALASKADQLKEGVTVVRVRSDADNGGTATLLLLTDAANINNAGGWTLETSGGAGTPTTPSTGGTASRIYQVRNVLAANDGQQVIPLPASGVLGVFDVSFVRAFPATAGQDAYEVTNLVSPDYLTLQASTFTLHADAGLLTGDRLAYCYYVAAGGGGADNVVRVTYLDDLPDPGDPAALYVVQEGSEEGWYRWGDTDYAYRQIGNPDGLGSITAWGAGEDIRAGQLLYNSIGIEFYPLIDITNPQAEPFLPSSTPQANTRYRKFRSDLDSKINKHEERIDRLESRPSDQQAEVITYADLFDEFDQTGKVRQKWYRITERLRDAPDVTVYFTEYNGGWGDDGIDYTDAAGNVVQRGKWAKYLLLPDRFQYGVDANSQYLRPGSGPGNGNVIVGPPDNENDITAGSNFCTMSGGYGTEIIATESSSATDAIDSDIMNSGGCFLQSVNDCHILGSSSCGIVRADGVKLTDCNNVLVLNTFSPLELNGVSNATYINGVLQQNLAVKDIYAVPAQKALDVIAAYAAAGGPIVETDADYYSLHFVDNISVPSETFQFSCLPTRPSVPSEDNVWKWFRLDLTARSYRDIYAPQRDPDEMARVVALFVGNVDTAADDTFTDANAPYGVKFFHKPSAGWYELYPDTSVADPNGMATPTWARPGAYFAPE